MTMTIDIDQLRTLLEAATPRPWKFDPPEPPAGAVDIEAGTECTCEPANPNPANPNYRDWCGIHDHVAEWVPHRDAELICAAVNALPELLAVYEAACKAVDWRNPQADALLTRAVRAARKVGP